MNKRQETSTRCQVKVFQNYIGESKDESKMQVVMACWDFPCLEWATDPANY